MKVKKDILLDFLKKASFYNTASLVKDCLINFDKENVELSNINMGNTVMSSISLKTSVFSEYEPIGKIVIQNIDKVIKIVSSFEEDVDFKVEGNLLVLKNKTRKIETELMSAQVYGEQKAFPNLPKEDTQNFNFDIGVLKELIKDMSINKEFNITFSTSNNMFIVKNDGDFKFTEQYVIDGIKDGLKISFGSPLFEGIENLNGMVNITIKNNFPVLIEEAGEHSNCKIVVAPRVSEGE